MYHKCWFLKEVQNLIGKVAMSGVGILLHSFKLFMLFILFAKTDEDKVLLTEFWKFECFVTTVTVLLNTVKTTIVVQSKMELNFFFIIWIRWLCLMYDFFYLS